MFMVFLLSVFFPWWQNTAVVLIIVKVEAIVVVVTIIDVLLSSINCDFLDITKSNSIFQLLSLTSLDPLI